MPKALECEVISFVRGLRLNPQHCQNEKQTKSQNRHDGTCLWSQWGRDWGRRIGTGLRPACATHWAAGQPGLYSKILSHKDNKRAWRDGPVVKRPLRWQRIWVHCPAPTRPLTNLRNWHSLWPLRSPDTHMLYRCTYRTKRPYAVNNKIRN